MNPLLQELDEKLRMLNPSRAQWLETQIREAMQQAEVNDVEVSNLWPTGYFENTAGAFADQEFERARQGELPNR